MYCKIIFIYIIIQLASNKWRKKLTDKTVLEREEVVLDVEMLERKAPLKWYKNGEEIKSTDR
jgi:hypothetical protein